LTDFSDVSAQGAPVIETQRDVRPASVFLLWRSLAGLQTGIVAGLAVLVFHMLDGVLRAESMWSFPNLISSAFFPSRALSVSLRWETLSGVALHFLISGLLGLVFSIFLARYLYRPFRCRLIALFLALVWYYGACRFLWPAINPAVVVFQPFPGMVLGHVLFGVCMGLYPRFVFDLGYLQPPPA
jgi:hypothetical protein